jgi:signal transduction histidine kinase
LAVRLSWRVSLANAAVLTAAMSPATVIFPIGAMEAVVLGSGLLLMSRSCEVERRESALRLLEAETSERQRILRELHDAIGTGHHEGTCVTLTVPPRRLE